jgi:hypothetical protein
LPHVLFLLVEAAGGSPATPSTWMVAPSSEVRLPISAPQMLLSRLAPVTREWPIALMQPEKGRCR